MKPLRKTALKRFLKAHPRPERALVIVLHDVEDPVNVGAAFRIADACGAQEILLTGITPQPPHKLLDKVGRRKDRRVPWRYIEDVVEALDAARADGFEILAVEITESAVAYHERAYPPKTCLVMGHEDHGVTKRALAACDGAVFIPMYGKGASLNVSVALGIMCFAALHGGASAADESESGPE